MRHSSKHHIDLSIQTSPLDVATADEPSGVHERRRTATDLAEADLAWFHSRQGDRDPPDRRARGVQIWLDALPPFQRGALALRFTPRKWALALESAFGAWTSLVVRFDCAAYPSAVPTSVEDVEARSVQRLEAELARDPDSLRVRRLLGRAKKHAAGALLAYIALASPPRERPVERPVSPAPARPAPKTEPRRREGSAVDEELGWYFERSEEDICSLPSNFSLLTPCAERVTWPTTEDLAHDLHEHRKIRDRLRALPRKDAMALRAAYCSWVAPPALTAAFGPQLGRVAVLLACGEAARLEDEWLRDIILRSKAALLEARAMTNADPSGDARLRGDAASELARALHAYRKVRRGTVKEEH
jgi:hypothetical protein